MARPVGSDIVHRFFGTARSATTDGPANIDVGPADVIVVSQDGALRTLFRDEFKRLNDPIMQELIKDYLADVIADLESGSERTDIKVDLIDRAGLVPGAGTLVAGIAALTGGVAAGPLLLAGGLAGVIISGVGRTYLRMVAQRSKASARKVRLLRESL